MLNLKYSISNKHLIKNIKWAIGYWSLVINWILGVGYLAFKSLPLCFILIICCNCSFIKKSGDSTFDRKKYVQEYLNFAFGKNADINYPKIYQAISNALNQIPEDVLEKISNPKHPAIFTVNITSGIARWANSSEFNLEANQERAFEQGFYLIKLADELENTGNVEAIEGIILHELSHDYLDHLKRKQFSCEMERGANRLVKKWGFEAKFLKAKAVFGSKVKGDSPCQDVSADEQIK